MDVPQCDAARNETSGRGGSGGMSQFRSKLPRCNAVLLILIGVYGGFLPSLMRTAWGQGGRATPDTTAFALASPTSTVSPGPTETVAPTSTASPVPTAAVPSSLTPSPSVSSSVSTSTVLGRRITRANVWVVPDRLVPGQTIEISGSDWDASSTVQLALKTTGLVSSLFAVTADSRGQFRVCLAVPDRDPGA